MNTFKRHHLARLEKWYSFLQDQVSPKKFDFTYWAAGNKPDVNVCGTTACGLGWAGSIPSFRKKGLRLIFSEARYKSKAYSGKVFLYETGKRRKSGVDAGEIFFGITPSEAWSLFIPSSSGNSKMTLPTYLKKVRRLIDKKKKELAAT